MVDLNMCEGTIDAEANTGIQEVTGYFSRTITGLILHMLQQHGFVDTECMCLIELIAVQICVQLKMYDIP